MISFCAYVFSELPVYHLFLLYSTGQASTDPFLANAGSGRFPNGSAVGPPPDPTTVYTPWNTTMAKAWLKGLANKPTLVAIDNEIEIASSTHQDMHPA
jgi:phosphatidylinositol glycan class B